MDINKIALEVWSETPACDHEKEEIIEFARRLVAKIQAEQEPVAVVRRNEAGQISLKAPDGHSFDMSNYVGAILFAFPPSTAEIEAKYYELIMSVGNKYPGETRHETALKYIRRAEENTQNVAEEKRGGK